MCFLFARFFFFHPQQTENKKQFKNMKLSENKPDVPNLAHRNSVKPGGNNEGGILHRVPFDIMLPQKEIQDEYDIEKFIAEGCFARIFLCTHRPTKERVILKAIHSELQSYKNFLKEYHYSYQLSHHPNISCSYQVAFIADQYYVFAQEYAALGKCHWVPQISSLQI